LIDTQQCAVAGESSCTTQELWSSINKFCAWLSESEGVSYDPYDVLGTGYGRWARRTYYRQNPLGIVLTAPLIGMEVLCPQLRALFVRKQRYPTADAQLALAFLNLYEACQEQSVDDVSKCAPRQQSTAKCLGKVRKLADELLRQSVSGYSGYCWGYPFDWQNVNGLMPKGTPHITATPYCYEVFTRLFDLTGEEQYLQVVRSIANFVCHDLHDTPTGEGAAASSYTPHDHGKVVNASAYRAFVLFDAARRFHNESYFSKAQRNLRFILDNQRSDGSWLYAIDNPPEAFIDNFHTCFVLKNLYKINRHLNRAEVMRSIRHGYDFYRKHLIDGEGDPKQYAVAPRSEIVRVEMYNFAEGITLGALLKNDIPDAFVVADELAARLVRQFQLPGGYFVTRVYRGGIRHSVPFLRWPQSQLFYALTNFLVALQTTDPDLRFPKSAAVS
jgi:hypothetical protein